MTATIVISIFLVGLAFCGIVTFVFLYDRVKQLENYLRFSNKHQMKINEGFLSTFRANHKSIESIKERVF